MALIALVAGMYTSSALACSIDALKKIADEPLESLPSSREHEFAPDDPPTESPGGSWQVFERENGTPHSILLVIRNEYGQDKIRLSFSNRRDYVITETAIWYLDRIQEEGERTGEYQIGKPHWYFFL